MTDYTEYFLNSESSVIQYETLEISHPDFSKTYRIVRNNPNGITATIEGGSSVAFTYYPLRIENAGIKDDLDQSIRVHLGDLGEVLPLELDAVYTANGFDTKPTVIYRTYRSDDLTSILFGPVTLEIDGLAFTREGASFEARAPYLNISKTGEIYTIDRFPMLRGFV